MGTQIRTDKGLVKAFEALLRIDPKTAGLGHGLAVTLGLVLTEPTQLLSTIFVVDRLPEDWQNAWTFSGWVSAEDVFMDRVLPKTPWAEWTAFKSEAHIRSQVPLYNAPRVDATSHAFDLDKIYLFEKEIYALSDIPGAEDPGFLDIVLPQLPSALDDQPMIPVYALDTKVPRSEVVDAFLADHPLWQWYLELRDLHPALLTTEWNLWMRNFVLGTYFNADAATHAGGRKGPQAPKTKENRDIVDNQEVPKAPPPPPPAPGPRDFDPDGLLRALNEEGGLHTVEVLAGSGPTTVRTLRGSTRFWDYWHTLRALESAGAVSVETGAKEGVTDDATVVLVEGRIQALVDYLRDLYPGETVGAYPYRTQLAHLVDPVKRRIVELVRQKPSSLSTLHAELGLLRVPVERYVQELLSAGLLFESARNTFKIEDHRGLALVAFFRTAHARSVAMPPKIAEAIEALRNPAALPLLNALSNFGTMDTGRSWDITGNDPFVGKPPLGVQLAEAELITGEEQRHSPYQVSRFISLHAEGLLRVVSYLNDLYPGQSPGKVALADELSLLEDEKLQILHQLSAGAQSLNSLQSKFLSFSHRVEAHVAALEKAELVVRTTDGSLLSLNPNRKLTLAGTIETLVEGARTSTWHKGQDFEHFPEETWIILKILSRHGPLPRARFHVLAGLSAGRAATATRGLWFEHEGNILSPDELVSLHTAEIQKSIKYFRQLFPKTREGTPSPDRVMNAFRSPLAQLILERVSDKPRTIRQLRTDLPRNPEETADVARQLMQSKLVVLADDGTLHIQRDHGGSLPAFLEKILADASQKMPIREIPEQALQTLGREGALLILGMLHRFGPQWGLSLLESTGLARGPLLNTLKALHTAGFISKLTGETRVTLDAQFSLNGEALEPIIAYLEATFSGELVGQQDAVQQVRQFGSIAKIMVIERLHQGQANLVDLQEDFPVWQETMPDLLLELAEAGLVEPAGDRNTFQIYQKGGLALTEHLKTIARNAPQKTLAEAPPSSSNEPEDALLGRSTEYGIQEMRRFIEEKGGKGAVQFHTKYGYILLLLERGGRVKALVDGMDAYEFVRFLDLSRTRSITKSAEAVVAYVPNTQPTFRVTDRGLGTIVFNHALHVVGYE